MSCYIDFMYIRPPTITDFYWPTISTHTYVHVHTYIHISHKCPRTAVPSFIHSYNERTLSLRLFSQPPVPPFAVLFSFPATTT